MREKIEAEEEEGLNRNSKDKKVNKEGWKLLERIGDIGKGILNGVWQGMKRGNTHMWEATGIQL